MKKRIALILAALMIGLAAPSPRHFEVIKTADAAEVYTLYSPVSRYGDAQSASEGFGSVGTYSPGTYYIYKTYGGMVNISKTPGSPGSWINPSENSQPVTSTSTVTTKATAPAPSKPEVTSAPPSSMTPGGTYYLTSSAAKYVTASDAVSGTNSAGSYPAGTYYIYKTYGGAVNISRTPGQPGGWIKPSYQAPVTTAPPITTTTPKATQPPVTKPPVLTPGNTYSVSSPVSIYLSAENARLGSSKAGTYPAGTYYIYKVYGAAINISRTPGTPGAWIIPSASPSVPSPSPQPSFPLYIDMSGNVSVENIYNAIKTLSTDYKNRPVGSYTGRNASLYIMNTLKSYGYNVDLQPFTASSLYNVSDINEYKTVTGNNVVAQLPGYDPSRKTVVFLSHYDTVIGTPGANDNASGVAMMMEMARYLKGKNLGFNPVFLVADAEETGKEGTAAWINSKSSNFLNNIEVVIDADMVGKGDYYQLWNTNYYHQSGKYPQLAKQIANEMNLAVGMALHQRGNSDYREFENRGIKAVTFMNLEDKYGNKESTYHTPYDSYEKISRTTLKNVADIILNLIRHIGR